MNYLNNHLRKKTFGKTQPKEKLLKKQKIQIANNVLKRQKIQNTKVSHFGKKHTKTYQKCKNIKNAKNFKIAKKMHKRNNYLVNYLNKNCIKMYD